MTAHPCETLSHDMARTRYSPERKAEALALYAEHGAAETSRRTGIAKGTLVSWAHRTGLQSDAVARTRAATEQAAATAAQLRIQVTNRMWQIADKASQRELELIRKAPLRDVVGARTRAIHDAQLLAGDPTARTETTHVDRTPENEQELAEVVEMFRVA